MGTDPHLGAGTGIGRRSQDLEWCHEIEFVDTLVDHDVETRHWPVNSGVRFSENAFIPSLASDEVITGIT